MVYGIRKGERACANRGSPVTICINPSITRAVFVGWLCSGAAGDLLHAEFLQNPCTISYYGFSNSWSDPISCNTVAGGLYGSRGLMDPRVRSAPQVRGYPGYPATHEPDCFFPGRIKTAEYCISNINTPTADRNFATYSAYIYRHG